MFFKKKILTTEIKQNKTFPLQNPVFDATFEQKAVSSMFNNFMNRMNMNDNIMYILRHSFLVSSHFQISGLMHYSTARFGSYCCVYFRLCYAMRIQKWDYLIVVPLKVRLFFSNFFFLFS